DPGKPKLVSALQQLKMILAMQRRVHNRTELYGKRYKGEQAPSPAAASNDKERQKLERIDKDLRDLAGRQGRLGKITREVSEPARGRGRGGNRKRDAAPRSLRSGALDVERSAPKTPRRG